MKKIILGIISIATMMLSLQLKANPEVWSFSQSTPASQDLKKMIVSILEENQVLPNGDIGISALNTNTGESFSINGDTSFFMASTYKIAIATQLLTLVDKKLISLDQMITVKPSDIVPGSGILVQYFNDDTFSLSVLTLLHLMLQESDNTATDLLLHLVGGPDAVMKRLQELNIKNMSVNRYTIEFTRDYFNIELPPAADRRYNTMMKLFLSGKPDLKKFLTDKRDNTTPNAMVNLLNVIQQGKALSPDSTKLLLSVMSKKTDETGRLYYFLPGVDVMQKLGTGEQVVNDVGILNLPDQRGSIVLAIYLRYVPSDEIIKDKVNALLAKTIYDYFLFHAIVNTTR